MTDQDRTCLTEGCDTPIRKGLFCRKSHAERYLRWLEALSSAQPGGFLPVVTTPVLDITEEVWYNEWIEYGKD